MSNKQVLNLCSVLMESILVHNSLAIHKCFSNKGSCYSTCVFFAGVAKGGGMDCMAD